MGLLPFIDPSDSDDYSPKEWRRPRSTKQRRRVVKFAALSWVVRHLTRKEV